MIALTEKVLQEKGGNTSPKCAEMPCLSVFQMVRCCFITSPETSPETPPFIAPYALLRAETPFRPYIGANVGAHASYLFS